MPESCPRCGHSLAVHITDDDGVFRCTVATCNCEDADED